MPRIGLISDTHGLLRPQALEALRGCDHIIHGGDIGKPEILQALEEISPVSAGRGNNDTDSWAEDLLETLQLQFDAVAVYVIHDLKELDINPKVLGISVVISGHSHKPSIEQRDGIFYVNPGSAGPRRFKLPITMAELLIDGTSITPGIIRLE